MNQGRPSGSSGLPGFALYRRAHLLCRRQSGATEVVVSMSAYADKSKVWLQSFRSRAMWTLRFSVSSTDRSASMQPASDSTVETVATIDSGFREALHILLKAFEYARDCQTDSWQFATELSVVVSHGASFDDVRWLVLRRFGEHAKEITVPGDARRTFRPLANTVFPSDAFLVLSPEGARFVRRILNVPTGEPDEPKSPAVTASSAVVVEMPTSTRNVPEWDEARRELRYLGQIVKRFRVPAKNQSLVLSAFQEDGWPAFIDDPICPKKDQDSKKRLQVTIKALNRNQIFPLIKFHGNGNGLQIYWEAVEPN